MQNFRPVYFDYNATTPVDPRVLEAMLPYFTEHFGNPASSQHMWGWTAQKAVEKARSQVAELLHVKPQEIFFTSGATEGNNWVLQSLFNQWREMGSPGIFHILSSETEHSSVLKTLAHLAKIGAEVEFVPVNSYGQVEIQDVQNRIRNDTKIMSFIWANNEIGSLNPMVDLAALAHRYKIYLHSDATQAVGKIPIDLSASPVDLLSLSAHKIYGPKGVGALFIRSRHPHIEIQPLLWGGGHERGLRSGTVNVPGVVGLGAACELCRLEMQQDHDRLAPLKDSFLSSLKTKIPSLRLNGDPLNRVYTNISLTFEGYKLERALPHLMRLGFSTGSACHSGNSSGSHVLKAIRFSPDEIEATLRLSIGRFTTAEDFSDGLQLLEKAFDPNQNKDGATRR